MARIPILRFGSLAGQARQFHLVTNDPSINLDGLLRGVDNLRHDVYLSPSFCHTARQHVARRLAHHAGVLDLLHSDPRPRRLLAPQAPEAEDKHNPAEFQRLLSELLLEALARAKARENLSVDLLARLAALKFLRSELAVQFTEVLERCRTAQKNAESLHLSTALEIRERVGAMLVGKRRVLRRTGQEFFEVMRDVEKQHLSRMRRSLFGDLDNAGYDLFLNRLLYSEDGRDDFLNAEHYVMLGNRETDPDRFSIMRQVACAFLLSLELAGEDDDVLLDGILSAPENAQELVAGGVPDAFSRRGKSQRGILQRWLEMLESAGVMDYVVAAYEVVPLLPEYSPTINAQQLKNALISREERGRVEKLIAEHGRLSVASLHAAVRRVGALRTPERAKMAGRFLADFMRYHRDLRRLQTLHSALDSVHLVADERVRQMSALNGMLYEFVLPEEHKPAEEKIVRHVVIKADIRDSTRLTRALSDRGLNPASHFSLNFYGPVNKLLAAYGASKVFLEGDAIILALLEREGESGFLVSRACMLAREIHDVVRAYNDHSRRADLPGLELGIGIAYQEASPMYLMDGDTRIMISDALNESDRLSSCSRIARRILPLGGPFGVYLFQLAAGHELNGLDDAPAHYNVGGIQLSAAAFARLQQEISLQEQDVPLPRLWENEPARLYRGLAPLPGGSFHPVVIREGRIPAIEVRDLSFAGWTNLFYYEVCTNPAVCEAQPPKSAGASAGGGASAR